jgi:transcriptional regulator with XRE-family HTH domain
VEAPELVRTARRHAGLSQRALAEAAGVDASTVAAVEAGRRSPGADVLSALVRAAGLELSVDRPVLPLCRHVRRHLHLSLSARLHLVIGGSGRPSVPPVPPAWEALGRLAGRGRVFLTGRSAVGLWIPGPAAAPLQLGLDPYSQLGSGRPGTLSAAALAAHGGFDLVTAPLPSGCTVTVALQSRSLLTPPPWSLAQQPECAPWRTVLRSVAAELDRAAAKDRAGRRSPAHREPDREDEAGRLLFARRWSQALRPPDRLDGRGWRLDDSVGHQEWIERSARRCS